MASTGITKALNKDIETHISRLLARGKRAFPCPFDDDEQTKLWHNMQPEKDVAAVTLLRERAYEVGSLTTREVTFAFTLPSKISYSVKFKHSNSDFLSKERYNSKYQTWDFDKCKAAAPRAEGWEEFLVWIENMAIIRRDFEPALKTLSEVLEFCTTIGQLIRAVPDLHKYLPRDKQEILQQQTRASNMPHPWHVFDRNRIANLQFAMAKASLLPAHGAAMWSEINETGAWFHV